MKRPMRWNCNVRRGQVRICLYLRHVRRQRRSPVRRAEYIIKRMAAWVPLSARLELP